MLFRFGIAVLLGHAEIDDMNDIGCFGVWSADQEIVGFDISVDQVLLVNCLDTRKLRARLADYKQGLTRDVHHLFRNHDNCLDREFSIAVVEEIFQTGT